jgi:hypothetical protein
MIDQGLMPGVDALRDLIEDAHEDGYFDNTGGRENCVCVYSGFTPRL